ncbi:MAG: XRE family transcriptional regulator [Rhodobacteraceae bacterium]|nr:MAG: XRE family transcriptional regulator [Paracoccaceae bacterium]
MLDLTSRLSHRLFSLRSERGWSLDELSARSGLARATLSRLENAESSPTADTLGKLCAAYGLTMSRLMALVEDGFTAHVPFEAQTEWEDPETGFQRRNVSPPSAQLAAEVIEGHLPPDTVIAYDAPPKPGLEHHLILLDGALRLTVDGVAHDLSAGDCLRYQLWGASRFETMPGRGARYLLVLA